MYVYMYMILCVYIDTHTHTYTFDTFACTMSLTHHIVLSGGGNVNPNRLGYE